MTEGAPPFGTPQTGPDRPADVDERPFAACGAAQHNFERAEFFAGNHSSAFGASQTPAEQSVNLKAFGASSVRVQEGSERAGFFPGPLDGDESMPSIRRPEHAEGSMQAASVPGKKKRPPPGWLEARDGRTEADEDKRSDDLVKRRPPVEKKKKRTVTWAPGTKPECPEGPVFTQRLFPVRGFGPPERFVRDVGSDDDEDDDECKLASQARPALVDSCERTRTWLEALLAFGKNTDSDDEMANPPSCLHSTSRRTGSPPPLPLLSPKITPPAICPSVPSIPEGDEEEEDEANSVPVVVHPPGDL